MVGEAVLRQMEMAGEYPDYAMGCPGGGSNFAGFAYPFLHQNLTAGKTSRTISAEPAFRPGMTRRKYAFDWVDQAASAPIVKMHTLGHTFIPSRIHAGGLRNHGAPALVFRCKCHPRPRERARHPPGHCRSAQVQSDRRKESHCLQPVRPRPLGHTCTGVSVPG